MIVSVNEIPPSSLVAGLDATALLAVVVGVVALATCSTGALADVAATLVSASIDGAPR